MEESIARKILIVEDEEAIAKTLGFEIDRHGYAIRTVYRGEEALKVLEKEKFDLVLLDLLMPQKGGLEVLKEMRMRGDKTPVVVLSNLGDEENIRSAKELGAQDYFVKANTPIIDVIDRIRALLG